MKIKYAICKGKVGLYVREYFDKFDLELFERHRVLLWYNVTDYLLRNRLNYSMIIHR